MERKNLGWFCIPLVLAPVACGAEGDPASGEQPEEPGTHQESVGLQSTDRVLNDSERSRMQKWLENSRVAPEAVRKRLLTAEGRNVVCVAAEDQPSVRRLKLDKLEEPPKSEPDDSRSKSKRALPVGLRTASGAPASCDSGTVPLPEITEQDLARFRTIDDFFRKTPSHLTGEPPIAPSQRLSLEEPHDGPTSSHQYAVYSRNVTNWGSLGTFNVWKPGTELTTEFSLLQTWVVSGTGSSKQTLEAGWQVYRDLYGDANPHLFIYSTQDGYESTGCYNNSCSDFVQRSSSIFPGQGLAPYSSADPDDQWQTQIRWVKDGDGGAWWLNVEGEYVGYYPRSLYNTSGVANRAESFRFGGEIVDKVAGRHTKTDMGSGQFPSAGFGAAAYINKLRYFYTVDADGTVRFREATGMSLRSLSDAACYDAAYASGDPSWGSYLYLGGPGYHSTNCR